MVLTLLASQIEARQQAAVQMARQGTHRREDLQGNNYARSKDTLGFEINGTLYIFHSDAHCECEL